MAGITTDQSLLLHPASFENGGTTNLGEHPTLGRGIKTPNATMVRWYDDDDTSYIIAHG